LRNDAALTRQLEAVRRRVVRPLERLEDDLGVPAPLNGRRLAESLLKFWDTVGVSRQLESWAESAVRSGGIGRRIASIHLGIEDQMYAWVGNLSAAFDQDPIELSEWLPILEAGLAGLTVGVVPPALDQVLVGTIDRSRNPDLRLVIVIGLNEGLFPATSPAQGLFTDADRRQLGSHGVNVGPDQRLRLSQERYYAYIAFTRASERLVMTWSEHDAEERTLTPSPLIAHVRRLFPDLDPEGFANASSTGEYLHIAELAPLAITTLNRLAPDDAAPIRDRIRQVVGPYPDRIDALVHYCAGDELDPAIAAALYGPVLRSSVSALEQFGACPFQFFIHAGLRAEERRRFEVDPREQGSFQHELLASFHRELAADRRRWRDVSPEEARERIARLGDQLTREFRDGLFASSVASEFAARALIGRVQEFVQATLSWMKTCAFDPAAVEVAFGTPNAELPAWRLDLGNGRALEFRGKIDRIDLAAGPGSESAYAMVIDYKAGQRLVDPALMRHGIQIQLPAYLATVRALPELANLLGVRQIVPAGAFYVGLRGQYPRAAHRREALQSPEDQLRQGYQHRGRFRLDVLPLLDSGAPHHPSGQFHHRFTRTGRPTASAKDVLPPEEFLAMLDHVEELLRAAGQRAFQGDIRIDPYRHGGSTPCENCSYSNICRIDSWRHRYRSLPS
jgi:ATP-dependent helicase/nuclease subunit B